MKSDYGRVFWELRRIDKQSRKEKIGKNNWRAEYMFVKHSYTHNILLIRILGSR